MKVVFLAREGIAARHIASVLEKTHPIQILFEEGGPARRRKLKRYFSKASVFQWPGRILDAAAAVLYGRQIGCALVEAFSEPKLTSETFFCQDVNDSTCAEILKRIQPDLILVYGTALLNKQTLSLAPLFLNLHGGIVPQYRNVHGEFWALSNSEPERVGTSVLYMDVGVDNGDLALQETIASAQGMSVRQAVVANTHLAAKLGSQVLALAAKGVLPRSKQDPVDARSFSTPGFFALAKAWFLKSPKI